MRRKSVRGIPLLACLLGVGVAILAAPPAANAATVHVCETFGNFCVGAPTLALNAPVVETGAGRDINRLTAGLPAGEVELQIAAAPSLCVAAANGDVNAVLHACQGGLGTVWIEHRLSSPGQFQFQDREFDTYLFGLNNGSQYQVGRLGVPGHFYNFTVS